MKVYVVFIAWRDGDGYRDQVHKICSDYGTAYKYAEEFDKEHFIEKNEVYTIVPEEIYVEWVDMHSRYSELYVSSYRGYTPEQFEKQERRVAIYDEQWNRAFITEYDVESSFKQYHLTS